MADFEALSKISSFSIYVEDVYTSSVSQGYTHATPFVARINLTSGSSPAEILNSCTLIWSFGDGTIYQIQDVENSVLQSTSHTYNWPGQYEVKLSAISNDGVSSITFSKTLSVVNFCGDTLQWDFSSWDGLSSTNLSAGAVPHGYQSCPPGPLNEATPITFRFTTSTTLSDRISFDLYSQNSLSQPWDVPTYENKYANLRPRWRFTDLDGNIISNVRPTIDQLQAVLIDKNGATPFAPGYDSSTETVVGYTGAIDIYYIDDIPSLNYSGTNFTVNAPLIWINYNNQAYPNYQDKNDNSFQSFSNNTVSLTSLFYIKNLSADHFNITVNGGNINLPSTLWPSTSGTFFVTINSVSATNTLSNFANKTLLNYPVSSSPIAISTSVSGAATFKDSTFNFSRTDSLGRDTGGFYKNIFYTLSNASSLLSSGSLTASFEAVAPNFTTIIEPDPDPLSGYNPFTRVAAATSTAGTLQVISVTGSSLHTFIDFDKTYFVRKINENFNYGAQLQAYALQPTIASNNNLFTFLSAIAGNSYTTEDNFGTKAYEKISNFVINTQDIDNSNVNSLYSLAKIIDNEFDDYNLNPPPVLKRAFDLFSTPHERLWGTREKYNTDFNNKLYHVNLGTALTAYNINTTIVSAGQKIVLNSIFESSFYELLEVPVINSYASVTAANMQSYFTSGMTYPLTAYPLSSFYGWGVKTPVANYYKFWVFNDVYNNVTVNNLIDWNNNADSLSTTLSESNSSVEEWYRDGGILENIYSYYIYKGLDLL
jgi:hypothetical protein